MKKAKTIKTKFFDVHVNFGGKSNGYSAFVKGYVAEDYQQQDVVGLAIDIGEIDPEDDKYVDSVTEITEEAYNRAKGI